jgi:ubiquinone/menaquinone biosynthesis C-methylase UbiE
MTEFDKLAGNYDAGFDDPVKRALGRDARAFLRPKIERLLAIARQHFGREKALRYLDFGCGTGDFLADLSGIVPGWRREGCDVSEGMLNEAKRRHPNLSFSLWNAETAVWPQEAYDIVTAVCVLHHIPPDLWAATVKRIAGTIVSGGLLVIFEHNPKNPITRWMIWRTVVDRHAVLLSSSRAENLLERAGFQLVSNEFFLFFPPRFGRLSGLERLLGRVPLGGQYLVVGRKR